MRRSKGFLGEGLRDGISPARTVVSKRDALKA
jgi:hypothetical protein